MQKLHEIIADERADFFKWFTTLLHACSSCFERDVLRGQENALWTQWLKEASLYDRLDDTPITDKPTVDDPVQP